MATPPPSFPGATPQQLVPTLPTCNPTAHYTFETPKRTFAIHPPTLPCSPKSKPFPRRSHCLRSAPSLRPWSRSGGRKNPTQTNGDIIAPEQMCVARKRRKRRHSNAVGKVKNAFERPRLPSGFRVEQKKCAVATPLSDKSECIIVFVRLVFERRFLISPRNELISAMLLTARRRNCAGYVTARFLGKWVKFTLAASRVFVFRDSAAESAAGELFSLTFAIANWTLGKLVSLVSLARYIVTNERCF